MQIAILISSLEGGGAQRATAELSRSWAEQGHRVTIVSIAGASARQYPLSPLVELVGLDLCGDSKGPIAAVIANFRRATAIRRWIKRLRPDVTIGMMDLQAVMVGLSCLGVPTYKIGCERTAPGHAPLPPAWRLARVFAYGALDAVIAQTAAAADWVLGHTLAPRVLVIPNSVTWPLPDGQPSVDPAEQLASDRKLILAVGRLSAEKRFELLLEAFASVAPARPDWDLAIVGEGVERTRLSELVGALGLGGRVLLPGQVGNVADWYRRASIFALTSEFEGFPNVLLEAMAHGAAPVSVDCPHGPSEIIRHGVNGLLVETQSSAAIAEALASLMDDEPRREHLAHNATQVRGLFSRDAVMAMWEQVLGGGAGHLHRRMEVASGRRRQPRHRNARKGASCSRRSQNP